VEVERLGDEIYLTIYAVHPGILIGRGGQNIERLKKELQGISSGEVKLTIREVERPELEAYPVAQNIAERIENRIPFRRVMKQAAFRTLEAGARGIKIKCSGRIGGREIARSETLHQGQMPLHKLSADISYGFVEARTRMGRIGVKTWIYRGDISEEVMRKSVTTETG
jgi:small subunit ribosomal protein S3